MFDFETEEIKEKFYTLIRDTTGTEPCYDPHLAANFDSPTDQYVEGWASRGSVSKAKAEALCASCPVLEQCRDYAIAAEEPYGIWGGTRPQDRGIKPKYRG